MLFSLYFSHSFILLCKSILKDSREFTKNASYIPSVRPGRETEEYLSSLLKKLATIGSIFLAFVALSPIVAQQQF